MRSGWGGGGVRPGGGVGGEYPGMPRVEGTPLLAGPGWVPREPVALRAVELAFDPGAARGAVTGREEVAPRRRPVRADGTRYGSCAEVVAALSAPATFEDRVTYRLVHAELDGAA